MLSLSCWEWNWCKQVLDWFLTHSPFIEYPFQFSDHLTFCLVLLESQTTNLLPVCLLFDLHMFTAVLADTQAETNSKTLYYHAKLKLIGVHTNTFSGYLSCSLFYITLDTISLSKLGHLSLQNLFVSLGGGGRYRSGCYNFPSTSYQSCLSSLAARLYGYCEELQCVMFSPLGREENTNVLKSSSLIRIYLNMYIQSTVSYSLLQCELDFIIPLKPENHPASTFSFFSFFF